jgi:4-amino-4-deoxy-L-arabinose transferase-like glycosyltransferase
MTGYPPLYPLVLAGLEWAGLSAVRAARGISALSYGLSVFLAGILARKLTRSNAAGLVASLIMLSSSTILAVYSWAWTEPAFVVLCLGCMLFLAEYLRSESPQVLIASALCLGIAMMLRYAGLALFGATAVVIAIHHWFARIRGSRPRWADLAAYLILAAGPLAAWLIRNLMLRGNPINRHLEWNPLSSENLGQLARTVGAWLLPASLNPLGQPVTRLALDASLASCIPPLLSLALLLAAVRIVTKCQRTRRLDLEAVLLAWIFVYLAFLVVSLVLFDPRIPLDDRILSPAYAPAVPLLAAGAAGLWRTNRPAIRGLVVAAALSLAGVHGFQLASTVQVLREDGQGYAASRWRSSPVMEILREQKPTIVYTNEIPAVYFNAGLMACSIPVRDDDSALETMRETLRSPVAVMVLFGQVSPEYVSEEELVSGLQVELAIPWDGSVYSNSGRQ